jgi:BNR repeat-like domain
VIAVGRTAPPALGPQGPGLHARDTSRPFRPVQVRSSDAGRTWTVEPFSGVLPGGATSLNADEHVDPALRTASRLYSASAFAIPPEPVAFGEPETAILCGRTGLGPGAVSWFYASIDRCRSWSGPFALPGLGRSGVSARTDVVPLGPNEALFMLSSPRTAGDGEGGTICAHTADGGHSFSHRGTVQETDDDGYAIMPSTVLRPDGSLLTALRRPHRLEAFSSRDCGRTWQQVSGMVADTGRHGNPPSLVALPDERVAVLYGRRDEPFAICARTSADEGRHWSAERTLVDLAGGTPDFGYVRTVASPDGFVSIYYANRSSGDRVIEAVNWSVADLN